MKEFLCHTEKDFEQLPACCVGSRAHVAETGNWYAYGGDQTWKLEETAMEEGGTTGGVTREEYELIETITLKEATQIVTRTKYPDGNSYALDAVIVEVVIGGTSEKAGNVSIAAFSESGETISSYGVPNAIAASSQRYVTYRAARNKGVYDTEVTNPGYTFTSMTQLYRQPGVLSAAYGRINYIHVSALTEGVYLPVGTVIKIYGVKANA